MKVINLFIDETSNSFTGLSMQLLETLNSSDLEKIIRLNVSLGRCYTQILDPKESIQAYQTALNVSLLTIYESCCCVSLSNLVIIVDTYSSFTRPHLQQTLSTVR